MSIWFPISTAPRMGVFFVYLPNERKKVQVADYRPNVKIIGNTFSFNISEPTHWMPFPPLPTTDDQQKRKQKLDNIVIDAAYDWTFDIYGELHGLVAGDMGYEPTGIKLDGVSLEIWELGCAAWQEKKKIIAATDKTATAY